ncbi:MAG: chorismate synthase [Halanaerobiaceae bacterium]
MLEFTTAGESHGKALLVIVEGLPAGIEIDFAHLNGKLARRQGGYGRGGRMDIEKDRIEIISGIRAGETTGSPVGMKINNRDWKNWKQVMSPFREEIVEEAEVEINRDKRVKKVERRVTRPRPGHADLAGVYKYGLGDIRSILERASARETAARTAAGGLLDSFLRYFDIEVISHVSELGGIEANLSEPGFQELKERVLESPLNCFDRESEERMKALIDEVREEGDSLGGVAEIVTTPLPVGLGSHTDWRQRLDGKLARALMSIPAIKGVEIGPAFANASRRGSEVHDEIYFSSETGFYHETNRAGGVEGGMTNGEPLRIRIAMKPIPTLYQPLSSVDIESGEPFKASVERSDVTAVPAAGVVGEAMVSFVLARSLREKFGGDNIRDVVASYNNYLADRENSVREEER